MNNGVLNNKKKGEYKNVLTATNNDSLKLDNIVLLDSDGDFFEVEFSVPSLTVGVLPAVLSNQSGHQMSVDGNNGVLFFSGGGLSTWNTGLFPLIGGSKNTARGEFFFDGTYISLRFTLNGQTAIRTNYFKFDFQYCFFRTRSYDGTIFNLKYNSINVDLNEANGSFFYDQNENKIGERETIHADKKNYINNEIIKRVP